MDLFHATGLKEHRVSFESTLEEIEKNIIALRNKYEITWNNLNSVRKLWASIQEDVIRIAKKYKYKFKKSLDKCSNEEIKKEIKNIIDIAEYNDEEILLNYIDKLDEYYSQMVLFSKEIENINDYLSKNHIMEDDKEDEYIIDLDEYRLEKQNKYAKLEEVIAYYPASQNLINKVNGYLNPSKVASVPFIEINELLLEANTDSLIREESEDYVSYKIKGNLTLIDIALSVYGDKELWTLLYSYSTNKEIIDSIATKYDVDVNTIVGIKGFLDGIELKFPLNIYAEYENEYSRKVA